MMCQTQSGIRAVIVDDEALSRSVLREYLAAYDDIEIVGECENGFEAVQAVNDLTPDLLFLDIQMPKLDGFEVLELIGSEVGIIFVTAYDQHAIRAFEVHAVDYLLKPFSEERLGEALDQARSRLAPIPVPGILRTRRKSWVERVLIRSGPRVDVIPVEKIDYVQAQDDYVAFKVGDREYLKQQTLNDLEAELDPSRFVRIHRSSILNIDRLARIERYTKHSHAATLKNGTQLPVSKAGFARLNDLL